MQSNILNPQDGCTLHELTDEPTDWRCLRIEVPSNGEIRFKSALKAIVAAEGNIAIVTTQPGGVDLYQAKAGEPIYSGSVEGIKSMLMDTSTETREI